MLKIIGFFVILALSGCQSKSLTPIQKNATVGTSGLIGEPSVTILVNKQSQSVTVDSESRVELSWESQNVTRCIVWEDNGTELSSEATSSAGLLSRVLTGTTTFQVDCINDATQQRVAAAVEVFIRAQSGGALPTVNLLVDGQASSKHFVYNSFSQSHPNGPDATLSWTSSNVDFCTLRRGGTDLSTASNGSYLLRALSAGTHEYVVACSGGAYDVESRVILNVDEPADHIFFTTHDVFDGNLGGLSGADGKCQQAAAGQSLRPDRPWKAVLGATDVSVLDRIQIRGNVFAYGSGLIADNSGRFWNSGSAWGIPTPAAANNDEHAEHVPDSSSGTGREVWSAMNANGALVVNNNSYYTCNNWTSTSGVSYVGDSNQADSSRFNINYARSCGSAMHLFCISQ